MIGPAGRPGRRRTTGRNSRRYKYCGMGNCLSLSGLLGSGNLWTASVSSRMPPRRGAVGALVRSRYWTLLCQTAATTRLISTVLTPVRGYDMRVPVSRDSTRSASPRAIGRKTMKAAILFGGLEPSWQQEATRRNLRGGPPNKKGNRPCSRLLFSAFFIRLSAQVS